MRESSICPLCGRNIAADHGLKDFNLQRHLKACPDQQRRAAQRAARKADIEARKVLRAKQKESRRYRRRQRKLANQARRDGVGSAVVPGLGQLGFPFQGVAEEVVE